MAFKSISILNNKIRKLNKVKIKKKTFFIAIFILLGIAIIVPQLLTKSRLADVISLLYYRELSPFDLFSLLKFTIALGDLRLISVYADYFNLILTHGFGSGLGSWSTGFLDTLQESGINPFSIPYFLVYGFVNMKPHAYGGLLAFGGFQFLFPQFMPNVLNNVTFGLSLPTLGRAFGFTPEPSIFVGLLLPLLGVIFSRRLLGIRPNNKFHRLIISRPFFLFFIVVFMMTGSMSIIIVLPIYFASIIIMDSSLRKRFLKNKIGNNIKILIYIVRVAVFISSNNFGVN